AVPGAARHACPRRVVEHDGHRGRRDAGELGDVADAWLPCHHRPPSTGPTLERSVDLDRPVVPDGHRHRVADPAAEAAVRVDVLPREEVPAAVVLDEAARVEARLRVAEEEGTLLEPERAE